LAKNKPGIGLESIWSRFSNLTLSLVQHGHGR
jgi:hypothetical protein